MVAFVLCDKDSLLSLDRLAWLREPGDSGDVMLLFVPLWRIWTL